MRFSRKTALARPHLISRMGPASLVWLFACFLAACSPQTAQEPEPVFGSALSDDATLEEILHHPDIFQRAVAVGTFFQNAPPEELEEIRRTFRVAPLDRGDIEYALFGTWWARFDPAGALYYALNDLRMEQPRIVNEILRTWAYMDPAGLQASGGFEDATGKLFGFRGAMLDSIVVGWFESGKPGLEDFILSQGDSESRQFALQAWVRMKILHEGEEQTLEWTQSVGYHADTKRLLLAAALATIGHQNPQLCVEWFHKAREVGIDVNTFVPRITNAWGHHDPRAAIEWALTFPESTERLRAVQRVARKWKDQDALGMQSWVDAQLNAENPPDAKLLGLMQHMALEAVVQAARYRPDWENLLQRAQNMKDAERGRVVTLWVLQRWFYVAPEEATAWMEQNPAALNDVLKPRVRLLPDDEREKIDRVLGRLAVDQL